MDKSSTGNYIGLEPTAMLEPAWRISTMPDQFKTAFSYCRWSSSKQKDGDSKARQEAAVQEWLKRNPDYRLDYTQTALGFEMVEETSSFRGRNLNPKYGALGKFIEAVKKENSPIKEGSVLIIERLDRFSRAGAMTAYAAINNLVHAGIKVVIVNENLEIDSTNVENLNIILPAVLSLCLANDESKKRSERLSGYWKRHREKVKNKEAILTKQLPCWIYYDQETKTMKADVRKAEIIKFIFKRIIDGVGQKVLCQELNKKYSHIVEPRKKRDGSHFSPTWNTSFISALLSDRKVIGELQPRKRSESGKYIPIGDPIKNYFPPIISELDFYAAQTAVEQRKQEKYQGHSDFVNLFTGLIMNGADGQPMHVQSFSMCRGGGTTYRQKRLQSSGKRNGKKNTHNLSVDYYSLEKLVLLALSEIHEKDYIGNFKPNLERSKLLKEIHWIETRIADLENEYKLVGSTTPVATIRQAVEELSRKKIECEQEFEALASVESSPKELKDISKIQRLFSSRNRDTDINLRYQLKNIIPTLVKKIVVWPYKRTNRQICARIIILLRSKRIRTCILVKDKKYKGLGLATYYGINKEPAIAICDCGFVMFEKITEAGENWNTIRDLIGGKFRYSDKDLETTDEKRAKQLLIFLDFCEAELINSGKGNIDFSDPVKISEMTIERLKKLGKIPT